MTKPMAPLADVTHWIFDLDNTLYRADAEFFSQIDSKMTEFIRDYLSIDTEEAHKLREKYWVEHGTTLSGLMAVHDMDPAEFLHFVHDVELDSLKPNAQLRARIEALPGQKYIYTNGSRAHAKNVATHLNLFDLFDGSFGIEDTHYVPKPHNTAYARFIDHFDIDSPRSVFFEDSVKNLEVPKALGMTTVLVTTDSDWAHTPETRRPAGRDTQADWIDHVTNDLPEWLSDWT